MPRTRKLPLKQHGDSSKGSSKAATNNKPDISSIASTSSLLQSNSKPSNDVIDASTTPPKFNPNDFLFIKEPPKFSGDALEDYSLWESQMNRFLDQFQLSADRKLKIANASLQGNARRIMDSYTDVSSLLEFYRILNSVFGSRGTKFQRAMSTKQGLDEPVRVFAARIRMFVVQSGVTDPLVLEDIAQTIFMQNVRQEFHERLHLLNPRKFQDAIDIAADLEDRPKRKIKEVKEQLMLVDSDSSSACTPIPTKITSKTEFNQPSNSVITEKLSNYHCLVKDKFQALDAKFSKIESTLCNLTKDVSKAVIPSRDGQEPSRRFRRRIMRCFHCLKSGHRYQDCFKATDADKREIEKRLLSNSTPIEETTSQNEGTVDKLIPNSLNSRKVVWRH